MAEGKDYLGEQLRLIERAREDTYFRKLNQELIDKMRHKDTEEIEEAARLQEVFTPILVPVDFSPYSTRALLHAADIAERFASSLIVLHVVSREMQTHAMHQLLDEGGGGGADMSSEALEAAVVHRREQAYTELLEFLPPRIAKYPVELRVLVGNPFERIVETAVRENVALIVLGTHGRTGLSRVFMGSVAERVVRLAPCPVLSVKAATQGEESWLRGFYETFISPAPQNTKSV
jgi:nucleotide-binding universal stress UspA family protein